MKESDKIGDLAIIVGIADSGSTIDECERSLNELSKLLNTAGGEVFARVIQVKESLDPRTCIGSGKVKELAEICKSSETNLVIFDIELSPSQIRNLENDIGNDVTVIDRSMLILDIFALHAVSGEGKLQVELAQLRYSAPRLMGHGNEMSRLGGGIGTRGPGETKLESDRRHMKEKIVSLERRLAELEKNRAIMRSQRDKSGLVKVALVGYTNAGKSTILNRLTGSNVLAENKLFATLDPTTRKMELPCGENILLTDTVGFVRKLPHHLVKAFKSTLDEVVYSDLLLIVSDFTDLEMDEHINVAKNVISELGASDKPVIYVYNKCDLTDESLISSDNAVYVSGSTGYGIEDLLSAIENEIKKFKQKYTLLIPYNKQQIVSYLYNSYSVQSVTYSDEGIVVDVILDTKGKGIYKEYIIDN